jgi:hypothetical protein
MTSKFRSCTFEWPHLTDRWDKLKRPAQFLHEARSTLILHAFGTGVLLLAAMIVTISGMTHICLFAR